MAEHQVLTYVFIFYALSGRILEPLITCFLTCKEAKYIYIYILIYISIYKF